MNSWPELDRFLQTDPCDVGCAEAIDVPHVYVDLVALPRAAPALGADTAAVLTQLLGLSAADVRALDDHEIIGGPVGQGRPGPGRAGQLISQRSLRRA
jgi:hypothetical protein